MLGSLGDHGYIKEDQTHSGSKKLWFLFFYDHKRKVLISKCLRFKLRLSQNVDMIDVENSFLAFDAHVGLF